MDDITYYELTHPQKRIWYIEKIYPDTPLYNIGGTSRFKGQIEFALLEESIHLFIRRHEGLRLQLVEEDGAARQYVAGYNGGKLDFVDFSTHPSPQSAFETWRKEESQKPFSLLNSPLYWFALFRIQADDGGYFVRFHHIIADGWSMEIITKEICAIYAKLTLGEKEPEAPSYSYLEYIAKEQEYLQSPRFLKNKRFWNNKFQTLPDSLAGQGYNDIAGRRKTFQLSLSESKLIKNFCRKHKISLNTFFTALFFIYLYKTTGQPDLVIGIPVLNRSGQKEKAIFGMFTSTMPLRINVNPKDSFLEFIYQVNRELMDCFFHQKYPYDLLASDLELKKKGIDSLFEICVNYYNTKLDTQVNGIRVEIAEFYNGNQFYALQMIIRDWSDERGLVLDFDYQIKRYDEREIEAIYRQLRNLEGQVLGARGDNAAPTAAIQTLSLLSKQEKEELVYNFNKTKTDYPGDKTIHQLFEEQAERAPDRTALRFQNTVLSYGDLNRKANQLAGFLRKRGAGPGSIIAVITTHSLETVIAILAVLKAGGAYLPVDPGYPPERIHYMLWDSGANLVLSNCCPPGDGAFFRGKVVMVNDPDLYVGPEANLPILAGPGDPAYIIYTSGSTGKPKGVVIEHRGLVNYIWWAKKMYIPSDAEAFALYSSLAFDLTVTSIFTPLISGSQIIIYHDDGSDFILDMIMEENQASIIKLTPSHLSLLIDGGHRRARARESIVRRFIVGGEDLKSSLAAGIYESFGGQIEIYNEYGPTETVVGCMIHQFNPRLDERNSVPIGIPADNVQIYILDRDLQPVPPGVKGEIYIGGDGVARGYLNRPELTAEKFIPKPDHIAKSPLEEHHETSLHDSPLRNNRLYRSGDLARFLENGKIEYCGRADHQVKIRGHRIELGEVEGFLRRHPLVKNGVVIDREDSQKRKYLCAYYESEAPIPESVLRDYLLRNLPEPMIPSFFVRLEKVPLTPNGKVDRNLLPELRPRGLDDLAAGHTASYAGAFEAKLAAVVAEVLGLEGINPGDNFYHLGGDSIKAIQIAAKLKNQGLQIKVKDILSNPVIRNMSAYLKSGTGAAAFEPCEGPVEATPITAWFFAQQFKNPNHWNQSVLLNLKPGYEVSQIETAFNILVKYHDAFRLNYDPRTGQLFYNQSALTQRYYIEVFDLSALPKAGQDLQMEFLGGQLKGSFNIENGILLKAGLFELGSRGRRLLLTAHHLACDGVSWRIILDDFASLLAQIAQGQNPVLPPKSASFQQWARELAAYGRRLALEPGMGGAGYWEAMVGESFQFPADNVSGNQDKANGTLIATLDRIRPESLYAANQAYNTKTHELLVIGLVLAVSEMLGLAKMAIELEGHGREEVIDGIDISRTVGWFTTLYPVVFQVEDGDLALRLKSLKEQLRKPPNQGFDFGVLKYLGGFFGGQAQAWLRFNYLGDFTGVAKPDFFELAQEETGPDCAPDNEPSCLLEINALVIGNNLQVRMAYNAGKFKPETMREFLSRYQQKLQEIIDHCRQKGQVEFTPSDFDTAGLSQAEIDSLFGG